MIKLFWKGSEGMEMIQWDVLSEDELIEMNGGTTRTSFSVADWFETLYKSIVK